jgi:hypothetical protein
MLITGRRISKIKSYDDPYARCNYCDSQTIRFVVYREYFHVFFIPIFPSDIKDVKGYCLKCGERNANPIKEEYLEKTRTPFYFYSLQILVICFVTTMLIIHNL